MDIHLLSVPYDTARRGERMGAGPEHLLRSGAVERLTAAGHRVRVEEVTLDDRSTPAEIATAFELQRNVAAGVRRAAANWETSSEKTGKLGGSGAATRLREGLYRWGRYMEYDRGRGRARGGRVGSRLES